MKNHTHPNFRVHLRRCGRMRFGSGFLTAMSEVACLGRCTFGSEWWGHGARAVKWVFRQTNASAEVKVT